MASLHLAALRLTALACLGSSPLLLAQTTRPVVLVPPPDARLDRLPGAQGESPGVELTARPGDGIRLRAGETFTLHLLTWLQPQFRYLANDAMNPASNGGSADTSSFRLRSARTRFDGTLFDRDVAYRLAAEWTETPAIEDAWIAWTFWRPEHSALALRFGQQKTFFGRESTAEDWKLDFVDRALATSTFANARSRGATLRGDHMDGTLHWTASAFNSDVAAASSSSGKAVANPDNQLDYVFTLRVDPNGDLGDEGYSEGDPEYSRDLLWSLGAGFQLGNHRTTLGGTTVDADGNALVLNGALKYRGVHALGEVFLRSDEPDAPGATSSDATGWQLGGTYTLERGEGKHGQWSFGGRYSRIELSDAAQTVLTSSLLGPSKGSVSEITALVGFYYRLHRIKMQGSWTLQEAHPTGSSSATNHILEVQFQFLF